MQMLKRRRTRSNIRTRNFSSSSGNFLKNERTSSSKLKKFQMWWQRGRMMGQAAGRGDSGDKSWDDPEFDRLENSRGRFSYDAVLNDIEQKQKDYAKIQKDQSSRSQGEGETVEDEDFRLLLERIGGGGKRPTEVDQPVASWGIGPLFSGSAESTKPGPVGAFGSQACSTLMKAHRNDPNSSELEQEVKITSNNGQIAESFESFLDLQLRLNSVLIKNISKLEGFQEQTMSILPHHVSPQIFEGLDFLVISQTASGKMASYLLPIIRIMMCFKLLEKKEENAEELQPIKPAAIILTPTREQAVEIFTTAEVFCKDTSLTRFLLQGRTGFNHQLTELRNNGGDLIIATTGRLLQFVSQGLILLDELRFLIVDDVDKMIELGLMEDMEKLVKFMPSNDIRTTGMFSSSNSISVTKAAAEFLKKGHVVIKIGFVEEPVKREIEQHFVTTSRREKRQRLLDCLNAFFKRNPYNSFALGEDKVLIYCNTHCDAKTVEDFLNQNGIKSRIIPPGVHSIDEELACREFDHGVVRVLIVTSVGSRSLNIPKAALVIHYDLPKTIEEYVKRNDRTENKGRSVSFYVQWEDSRLASGLREHLFKENLPIPRVLRTELPLSSLQIV